MRNCDKDLFRPYNSKDTSFFVRGVAPTFVRLLARLIRLLGALPENLL
jgi:hypothetical protein